MSTVKIKTEPATTTAAATTVEVKVQASVTPKKQQQFICEHPRCGCSFDYACRLERHQNEHKLQTEINTVGKTYILTRQSLTDRWPCPFPDCTSKVQTVDSVCTHIRKTHVKTIGQQHQQQSSAQTAQNKLNFLNVDDFYVNGVRCGYHNTTGVFVCYECKLVPECLLTHLQSKHGYNEKSIDSAILPESSVNATVDPNGNQHTGNPHLVSAISKPHWQHQHGIVQGWQCVISDCGYCGYSAQNKFIHKKDTHQGEQISTVPALVLRLSSSKLHTTCYFITRLDYVTTSGNWHKLDYIYNGLITRDDNGEDDTSQSETTNASNQKQQYICEHPDCGHVFRTDKTLSVHRREHKRQVVINVQGTIFVLTRQSLNDRWACPVPDCEATFKSLNTTYIHIHNTHGTWLKQNRTNSEEDGNQQQQQNSKKKQLTIHYLKADDFLVNGVRCGYHIVTGVFICHACRLVPECLLTHLQQKHGFDDKLIDNSSLPESAVNANADPNGNQHTSNSYLAPIIREPNQPHHPDIIQGWLCVTCDSDYCCSTSPTKSSHKRYTHQGEQISTVPALVLRLLYGKTQTTCFLITRLDTQ